LADGLLDDVVAAEAVEIVRATKRDCGDTNVELHQVFT
jgi:hypothetical protein